MLSSSTYTRPTPSSGPTSSPVACRYPTLNSTPLAARSNMPHHSPASKAVSLSIDSQAAIGAVSCPGYPYQAPLPRHPQNHVRPASLGLISPGRVDTQSARHHWQRTCFRRSKARCRGQPSRRIQIPLVVSPPALRDPRQTPPGVAGLAQTESDSPLSSATRLSAIFAAPRHVATCLFKMKLAPGPPNLASPRTGAMPTV